MRYFKFYFLVFILTFFGKCCTQSSLDSLLFLQGTWKAEDKNLYEEWKLEEGVLSGKSYKINNGIEEVSEHVKIKTTDGEVIYTAKVFDQNEGDVIPFKLHRTDDLIYSFENPKHDFPQKIIYEKKSDSLIYVNVLGSDGQGFSYFMKKM